MSYIESLIFIWPVLSCVPWISNVVPSTCSIRGRCVVSHHKMAGTCLTSTALCVITRVYLCVLLSFDLYTFGYYTQQVSFVYSLSFWSKSKSKKKKHGWTDLHVKRKKRKMIDFGISFLRSNISRKWIHVYECNNMLMLIVITRERKKNGKTPPC